MKEEVKKRLYYLDIIKLCALVLVFVCHYTRSLESRGVGFVCKVLPDSIFHLYIGSFGVTLFFIASGASLMYVYQEKLNVKNYFKKRFLGIYPMFWIAIIVATCISMFRNIGIDPSIPKGRIIYSILGWDGNALWWGANFYQLGEWFLGVIMCLYLLFPLLRKCVLRRPVLTTGAAGVIVVLSMLFFHSTLPLECFVLARMMEFVLGMLFIRYLAPFDNRCAVAGIVGVVGLAAAAVIDLSKYNIMLQILLVGASAFCLFSWIAKKISFLNIVKKLSGICAKYCFPFFLTHHYLLEWLTQRFTGYTLRRSEVYLLCLACFAVSWVVSYYLDRVTKAVLVFFKTVKN